MENYEYEEDKEYLRELLDRFENRASEGNYSFFDSWELEDIIYYYFNESEYTKALYAIDFAIDIFPDETSFHVFKAQYFLSIGQHEKALSRLKKLSSSEPENADIILSLATAYSYMHRHKEAIREFLRILELSEESPDEIHEKIGFEYQSMEDFPNAIFHLKKAYNYDPDINETLLYEIGYTYGISEQHEEAIAFFKSIINKSPHSYAAWYNLGMAYSNYTLYEKAIDAFDYAIAINPDYASAYISKAQAYDQMDLFVEAINTYKQSLEIESPDTIANYYIAECLVAIENYDTALEYFRKSISLGMQFPDAWLGMGICYMEMKQPAEGLAHIKQAIKLDPENPDYLIVIAQYYMELGQSALALDSYQKASELDPLHPDIWLDYADFFVETENNYEKALEILEEGIYRQKDNTNICYRRVAYLYLSGQVKEAVIELFIALTMDYDAHKSFLDYNDVIKNADEILQAIASFKNHNNFSNN